jgi:hypothetical protein
MTHLIPVILALLFALLVAIVIWEQRGLKASPHSSPEEEEKNHGALKGNQSYRIENISLLAESSG